MNRPRSKTINGKLLFVLAIAVGIVFSQMAIPAPITAQTSNTLNFQGKIVRNDSGSEGINVSSSETSCIAVGADTCGFQVVYYDAASAGNTLATETFTNVEIGDNDGIFNLAFGTGSFTAGTESTFSGIYLNNTTVYSEVRFDHDGNATYTEIFGRMANRAAPYAIRANSADNINGLDESDFVQFAPSAVQTDTTTVSSIFINKTGASGSLLQLQNSGSDVFTINHYGHLNLSDVETPNTWNTIFKLNSWTTGLSETSGGFNNVVMMADITNRTFLNLVTDNSTNSLFSGGVSGEN